MVYVSEWERLSDALMRVMATFGLSKDEAQTDICQAIADGAVNIRGKLKRHATRPITASNTVLEGKDFRIPTGIKPADLDWEASRPTIPWTVKAGVFGQPGPWDLEWIEVSRTDVTNVFRPARNQVESAQYASSEKSPKSRSRPGRDRANWAIKELYPQGVPKQTDEPNKNLCKRVGEKLKEAGLPGVLDDTILRAAGRRK